MSADHGGAPDWLRNASARLAEAGEWDTVLRARMHAPAGARPCAILIVLSPVPESAPAPRGPADVQVLLTERAHTLRSHAAQVAFPGGAIDPDDGGPVGAALREAEEETGLNPAGVAVVGTLPELAVPRSNNVVTPVIGWSAAPAPVRVMDPAEVASVHWVSVRHLLDPAYRLRVRLPAGVLSPAFLIPGESGVPDPSSAKDAADLVVWGFTGGLLERIFALTGWERPWDRERVQDLPLHLMDQLPADERHEHDGDRDQGSRDQGSRDENGHGAAGSRGVVA